MTLCLVIVFAYYSVMPVSAPSANDIYTISRLNREVRTVLEEVFPTVWVQGEISNLARPASGHMYFTLKDSNAQVRCAMFRNRQTGLRFEPESGMEVLVRANVGLYEGRGEYQLIIESMEPAGEGALQLAFEKLKQTLAAEGLFDETHKRLLPAFPEYIGIITSPTGAAVRDIISVLERRYPSGKIIVYPVPVQGEGAGKQIAAAIQQAEARNECDVLILTRGGGSLEDLWAFNEEIVARAVFACQLPIVSGVGHEIDFSISDFVADQRAPTPSVAAELVSPDSTKLLQQLQRHREQLLRAQDNRMMQLQRHVDFLSRQLPHPKQILLQLAQQTREHAKTLGYMMEKYIAANKLLVSGLKGRITEQNPTNKIERRRQAMQNVQSRLHNAIHRGLDLSGQKLAMLEQKLNTISPLSTLERGYAIVTERQTGKLVKQAAQLNKGDHIAIRLAKAEIESTVDKIHEK